MDFLIGRWRNRPWSAEHQVGRERKSRVWKESESDRRGWLWPSHLHLPVSHPLQPHWPPHFTQSLSHTLSLFLPQGLDTGSALCLQRSSPSSAVLQCEPTGSLLESSSLPWWAERPFLCQVFFFLPSLYAWFLSWLITTQNYIFNCMLISCWSLRVKRYGGRHLALHTSELLIQNQCLAREGAPGCL